MKVLITGGGGREHALAWKAAQSSRVKTVFVAPGNAGTRMEDKVANIDIAADDVDALLDFAKRESIDLTVVGGEAALMNGIADAFAAAGLACFGPTKSAAQLEGSKTFCKNFLTRHGIATAAADAFDDCDAALAHLSRAQFPRVIKADGLAAGKGVVIAKDLAEATHAVRAMMTQHCFGDAGRRILIEEFLPGEELSFIVICDGEHALPLASSQDHKAAHDGDRGPNTGGMGAISPAPSLDDALHARIMQEVIMPTLRGMAKEGNAYRGFLYAGLMLDADRAPRVLEFNCRLGDPETQPILLRLQSDLVAHILAAMRGELSGEHVKWDSQCALGVVMAAAGYPGDIAKGETIRGLENRDAGVKVFHAGTADKDGAIVTNGGRVLCVTALGADARRAQQRAYAGAQKITWHGAWYRRDIGRRALEFC